MIPNTIAAISPAGMCVLTTAPLLSPKPAAEGNIVGTPVALDDWTMSLEVEERRSGSAVRDEREVLEGGMTVLVIAVPCVFSDQLYFFYVLGKTHAC
jgi:hypothetical protein